MSVAADPGVRSALGLLSAWIESQTAYSGLPGLSIGIVHDQQLVWAAGFGRAGLEPARPATPDTLYRIASITKLFTSTAILQLRDAGKLRLDDPLVEHLPWFPMGGAGHREGRGPAGARGTAGRYAGRYRSPWADVQVLVVEGRLAMIDPSLPDPMLNVTWLHPVSEHTFRGETKNGFGSHGEPVVFSLDDAGRVARLKVGENFLTSVSDW